MRFRIDIKIFLISAIFCITNQIHIYMLTMVFALIHELGHLFAGILLKMKPEKIEIIPTGVAISFKLDVKQINKKIYKGNMLDIKKILVALSGPITNLLIIIITINMNVIEKQNIIYANLLILIFNLIPIYPLDGGRIIKGVFNIMFGKKQTIKNIRFLSVINFIILTLVGIILLISNCNFAIIVILAYIWVLVIKEYKIFKQKEKIYKILEENY